jgi:hypothetical protein
VKKPWEFDNPVCAEVGHQLFYLDDRDDIGVDRLPDNMSDYRKAQSMCTSCVHQFDCAEWGIKKERHGVWGGLTPHDREQIRKKRNILLQEELSHI